MFQCMWTNFILRKQLPINFHLDRIGYDRTIFWRGCAIAEHKCAIAWVWNGESKLCVGRIKSDRIIRTQFQNFCIWNRRQTVCKRSRAKNKGLWDKLHWRTAVRYDIRYDDRARIAFLLGIDTNSPRMDIVALLTQNSWIIRFIENSTTNLSKVLPSSIDCSWRQLGFYCHQVGQGIDQFGRLIRPRHFGPYCSSFKVKEEATLHSRSYSLRVKIRQVLQSNSNQATFACTIWGHAKDS